MDYDEDEYFDNGMGFQFNNNNNNNFIPPVTPPPMYTMPAESTFPNRTNTIPVNNENSIPGQPAYTPTVASQPGYGLGFPPSASPNKPLAETPRERSIHSSNHGGEMRTPLRSNVGADPSITNRFFNGPTPKRASPSVPTNNTLHTSLNMSRASSSREPVVPASMLGAPGANPYYMFDNNNNNSMPPPPQQPTPSPVRVANTSDNSLNSGARNTNNNNNEALEQPYNVSVPPHTATVPPPPEALQVHRTPVNQSHTSSSNAHSGYVNSPSAVSSIHHPTDRLAVVTPAQNSSFASSNTASTTPSKFIYPRSAQRPPIILRHEVPQEDVPPARTPFCYRRSSAAAIAV
ncbi:hypothetical protein AGDE_14197 [Angomonas deanei]|uniref:Uncharacterized protein n=1 Tax=Angomonas deanei TaxID=59799 RepID=A0A7G2CPK2_9TRYP|nr:hypothetical protein AGDE_14197 [Angomonas deanei]CAD2221027.1 hypothetical protein, conserved [Angomonas deanei]|eukprot:EPY21231.1 hypothetical protein AGDE_14197 [Angomonas deanei]